MARYISDVNKLAGLHESGTYGVVGAPASTGSVFWIGEVTEHSVDDTEGKLINRYVGASTRSFNTINQGPLDVTGTITYNVQNFRIPFWSIGSTYDSSGTQSFHSATQISTSGILSAFTSGTSNNAPISFSLQDGKESAGTGRNFLRTLNGCIPNVVTITATQGEKVTAEIAYIAQNLIHSSGATATLSPGSTANRPYLWSDTILTLGGSIINTAKEISLEINNNYEAPHYLNGSRVIGIPFPSNRDITLSVTMDLDGLDAAMLYNEWFKTNGSFNAVLDFDNDGTGSQHAIFTLSGCYITSFEIPTEAEGVTESTMEIRPTDISAREWTSVRGAALFNPF